VLWRSRPSRRDGPPPARGERGALGPRDPAPNSSAGRWRLNGNARDVGKNRRASATRERATISGYARSMARPATVEGTAGSPATPLKRAAGPLETTSKTPGLAAWAFLQGYVVPFPYGGRCPILDVVMLEGGSNQARDAALLKERQDGRQDRHRRRRPYAHDGRRWSQTVFF